MPAKPRSARIGDNERLQDRLLLLIQEAIGSFGNELEELKSNEKIKALKLELSIDEFIKRRIVRASRQAVKALMPELYIEPNHVLPRIARIKWAARSGHDLMDPNPINFLERYWGQYLDDGSIDLCELRKLDESLVEAVKIYCKNRALSCKHYLPLPARKRTVATRKEAARAQRSKA